MSLLSLAQHLENKYKPLLEENASNFSLFQLINHNSHLLERLANEVNELNEKLISYEEEASFLHKDDLIELHKKLKEMIDYLQSIS